MNFSAVKSGWFRYPLARLSPPIYSSPLTPMGTGCSRWSKIYIWVFATGFPIGTKSLSQSEVQCQDVTSIAASVGPYRLWRSAFRQEWNLAIDSASRASPLQKTCFRLVHLSTPSEANQVRSIGGTK